MALFRSGHFYTGSSPKVTQNGKYVKKGFGDFRPQNGRAAGRSILRVPPNDPIWGSEDPK